MPTPLFLPVGSQGAVKTLTPEELKAIGVKMVLGNTYHLYLRPGIEIIEKLGGLHRFISWDGPILTDSGGYQVFSLASLRRVSDEGVSFRSHIDGSEHFFTPELVIQLQEKLGGDIIMTLDECPPYSSDAGLVQEAMERTHRWAERCQRSHRREGQALYGIVQGGIFPELRRESAGFLTSLGFSGYAIGGLSLGEPKELTWAMLEETVACLPKDKPRYLMGVGSPEDLFEGVSRGVDLFDSALPTRTARNGALFTALGRQDIQNARYRDVDEPIDPRCDCYTCHTFSAAYLHHLFKSKDLLAYRLATIHNLRFILKLMEQMRQAILDGNFITLKESFLADYQTTDEETRLAQKQRWLERFG
jgi:queuine tRNA-ribosyltransferase